MQLPSRKTRIDAYGQIHTRYTDVFTLHLRYCNLYPGGEFSFEQQHKLKMLFKLVTKASVQLMYICDKPKKELGIPMWPAKFEGITLFTSEYPFDAKPCQDTIYLDDYAISAIQGVHYMLTGYSTDPITLVSMYNPEHQGDQVMLTHATIQQAPNGVNIFSLLSEHERTGINIGPEYQHTLFTACGGTGSAVYINPIIFKDAALEGVKICLLYSAIVKAVLNYYSNVITTFENCVISLTDFEPREILQLY